MNATQKFAATVQFKLQMSSQRPLEPKVKQCLQHVADAVQTAFSKRLLEIYIVCRDDIPKYAPHDGFRAFQFHITFSRHPTASGRVTMALPLEISLDGRNILIGLGNVDEKQHFGALYGKNIKVRGLIELVRSRLAELDAEVLLPPSPLPTLPPELIFRRNAEKHIRELTQENKADSHAWEGVADTFQAKIEVIGNDGKIVLSFPQYKYVDYQNRTKEYEARTVTFVFPDMGYRGLYFLTDTGERRDYGWGIPNVTQWMFIALINNPAKQTPASIQAEKQRLDAEEEERSRVTPDTITSFLKSMRTSSGGRNISVDYHPPGKSGAWHYWEVTPQNRSRLDHYGNSGGGWDEQGWNESYANPLSGEVQEKLDERFGKGIFEVDIGEKGHIEVNGHPKKMETLIGLKAASSPSASRVAARAIRASVMSLQDALAELDNLNELSENISAITDTFELHFKTAGAIDPTVKTQFSALEKARAGLTKAKVILQNVQELAKLYPEDKTAQRALADAGTMVKRYVSHVNDTQKMIQTLSKKQMPAALKKMSKTIADGIQARLINPDELQVLPWQDAFEDLNYETKQRGACFQVVFRLALSFDKTAEIILKESTVRSTGPYLSEDYSHKPTTAKAVIEAFLEKLRGYPGLKGESEKNSARAPIAAGVFSKIPGKSLDQMIMARYQYEFDGEQSSTSREESLAHYRKKWLAMTADKQQEIVKWLQTNRYTVYHDIRKYL